MRVEPQHREGSVGTLSPAVREAGGLEGWNRRASARGQRTELGNGGDPALLQDTEDWVHGSLVKFRRGTAGFYGKPGKLG